MKKIIIATDNYFPRIDGIARFLKEIIPELQKYFKVSVLAPDFGQIDDSVDIVRFPLTNIRVAGFNFAKPKLKVLTQKIRESDLVFIQSFGTIGFLSLLIAKRLKKNIVIFQHSLEWELFVKALNLKLLANFLSSIIKFFTKHIYNLADAIILPGNAMKELIDWHGIRPPKFIATLGINTNLFKPPKDKIHAKLKIGLNPKKIVIGYHGRISYEKGIIILVRTFKRLKRKFPNIELIIVGDGLLKLKKYIKSKSILLIDGKQDIVPYLQAMDIYAIPTLTETTCLSLLEAMAVGVPVIASKVGLIPEHIGNDRGLLIQPNPFELYKAIELLINNPDLQKKFSNNALLYIQKNFSWKTTAIQIKEIFDTVLKDKNN